MQAMVIGMLLAAAVAAGATLARLAPQDQAQAATATEAILAAGGGVRGEEIARATVPGAFGR